jgi:hypothetical protein
LSEEPQLTAAGRQGAELVAAAGRSFPVKAVSPWAGTSSGSRRLRVCRRCWSWPRLVQACLALQDAEILFDRSANLRLIDKWRPKRAYMIHCSGYEDQEHPDEPIHGPMTMQRFREELQRVAEGRDIRAAEHGMILRETEPWPE